MCQFFNLILNDLRLIAFQVSRIKLIMAKKNTEYFTLCMLLAEAEVCV